MIDQQKTKNISICVCTRNRNIMLRRLIHSIVNQQDVQGLDIQIVISDNDPHGGAKDVYKEFVGVSDNFHFSYGVEITPGIPYARNNAVSMTHEYSEFVIFVDDDEYMTNTWLNRLLTAQELFDADVVLGPSYPEFSTPAPDWIFDGKFFLYPVYKNTTGTKINGDVIATNNLLVRKSILNKIEGPFDVSFGMTGSDDSKLGKNLDRITDKMFYTHEAVAYEIIPSARMNFRWIMQRSYRSANTLWLLEDEKNWQVAVKYLLGSVARIAVGATVALPSVMIGPLLGWHYLAKSSRLIVRGIGVIVGMTGRYYEEYKHNYTSEK